MCCCCYCMYSHKTHLLLYDLSLCLPLKLVLFGFMQLCYHGLDCSTWLVSYCFCAKGNMCAIVQLT